MVVVGIADEVNVQVGRCGHRLATLTSLDDFLELRGFSLDLATRILGCVLQFLVWVRLDKVVVTCQDCFPLLREVLLLVGCPFLDGLLVLVLLLLHVNVVKTRWIVNHDALMSL